ncbi:MAG: FAD-binding oxidoreductase [Candidatus Omnitrophica bacterium]|nr:FAD-binding oxidoreductase [Candidatus Omnitrophota bacterium]
MIIKNNKEDFLSYLEDTSNIEGHAESLYIPHTQDELVTLVARCNQEKIPLTISAGRTGTTGGCVPQEGVLVSLEEFNRILSIDKEHKRVSVQAGVVLEDLERELNRHRLALRAQPTESLACVGGAVSTAASGVRGYRWGGIRKYVERIKILFVDGTVFDICRGEIFAHQGKITVPLGGRTKEIRLPSYRMPHTKTQAGYFVAPDMDLIDLFIGSEGTLGIILEIEFSVQELAEEIFDCIVFFKEEKDAFRFVETIKEKKSKKALNPTSLEFLDARSLRFLGEEYPQAASYAAAVYIEQEESSPVSSIAAWIELIESSGALPNETWFGDSILTRKKIFEFRHKLPQRINEFLKTHRQRKLSTDVAVPEERFLEMYGFYAKEGASSGIEFVNFGHIGENHLHFNFLPRNDDEYRKAKEYTSKFIKKAIELGGTVSAEHGIGKLKKESLLLMYGEEAVGQMRVLKGQFDPNWILNRGNIFDCKE